MKLIVLAALAVTWPCATAIAADTRPKSQDTDAVPALVRATQFSYVLCQTTSKLALDGARADAELARLRNSAPPAPPDLSCIRDGLANAEPLYQKANAVSAKNKTRNALLKDYFAAWRSAMNGIRPEMGEIGLSYNRRQASTSAALNEKAERLALE